MMDHHSPTLSHLDRLEAESIHIMREVAAETEHPVMLYSVGKDSSVMLHLAQKAFHAVVIDHDRHAVPFHDGAFGGEIERRDLDIFAADILPDVEFGPVGQREDPDAFALADIGIVDVPQFRTLVFRIPAMFGRAEGEDALLGGARTVR